MTKKIKEVEDPTKRPNSIDKMIISFLNRLWSRWPAKTQTKNKVRERVSDGFYKNGNEKFIFKFRCEDCKELQDKVEVDHIEPRICVEKGYVSLDEWATRTFCEPSGLRALCVECHKIRTTEQAGIRAVFRKERKTEEKS